MSKRIITLLLAFIMVFSFVACDQNTGTKEGEEKKETAAEKKETKAEDKKAENGKPETWIADREINLLVFQSADDAGEDSMSDDIKKYIKDRTGITLNIQSVSNEDSKEALAAGLASGDLPDAVAFYLNNSGRPEFPLLLKASNEGMFHDIAPFLKESKTYSKYFEEGYLPKDTKENIMMREDQKGATYLVHMAINRKAADPGRKTVGGLYIRKDIAEDLKVEMDSIKTSEQMTKLLKDIKAKGYKDNNGKDVYPLGPTVWGGSDRPWPYADLVYQGAGGQKFLAKDGKVQHEAMTDFGQRRVALVQEWLKEGLMHPEYYTMEEARAQEGIANKSFAIITDTHNYRPEMQNMDYIPMGDLQRADGSDNMVMAHKSGYAGWAVPKTTEKPEEVVKFADWLAGPEGKLLYFYGIEGKDYDMVDGKPMPKKELVKLQEEKPEEANKRGFRGVRAWWGEHFAMTDLDNLSDYGESSWGEKVKEADSSSKSAAAEITKMYKFDEKYNNKTVIDGLYPKAFLFEFEGDDGKLSQALEDYDADLQKAFYAQSKEESDAILEQAKQKLMDAKLSEFCEFLQKKEKEGEVIFY